MKVVIAGASGAENLRLVSTVCAAGDAWIVALAKSGADALRTVLDEEPDVLILGSRFDPKQGLVLLHSVRPLLPALRIVAVDDRRSNEFRRAFLLGDIDLLLSGPDRAEVILEVLQQWQRERQREPWAPVIGALLRRSPAG
jgi:chemotaxis response regulator CheB